MNRWLPTILCACTLAACGGADLDELDTGSERGTESYSQRRGALVRAGFTLGTSDLAARGAKPNLWSISYRDLAENRVVFWSEVTDSIANRLGATELELTHRSGRDYGLTVLTLIWEAYGAQDLKNGRVLHTDQTDALRAAMKTGGHWFAQVRTSQNDVLCTFETCMFKLVVTPPEE